MMRLSLYASLAALIYTPALAAPAKPIIDVHRHAAWPGSNDAEYRSEVLIEMNTTGIVLGLLHINEPTDVSTWAEAAPMEPASSRSRRPMKAGEGSIMSGSTPLSRASISKRAAARR